MSTEEPSVQSQLFITLGSLLYKIETTSLAFHDKNDGELEDQFEEDQFEEFEEDQFEEDQLPHLSPS